jgi:drug/metabolite transporter (DMT)-like permease
LSPPGPLLPSARGEGRDLALVLLIALFWGLNWPAVKIALGGVSPWLLRAIGLACGAAVLAGAALLWRQTLAVPRNAIPALALSGLLGVAGFNICAVFAQLTLPTSRAAILTFTMPFWAALFSWWFLGEAITRRRAMALALGGCGLVLLSAAALRSLGPGAGLLGLAYVLGAAVSWAAGSVVQKAARLPLHPLTISAWQLGLAALVAAAGTLLFETPRLDLGAPRVAPALAFHILLPMAFCYLVWVDLVARLPVARLSVGTLLIPIVGVTGSMALLGETPSLADWAGFACILAGLAVEMAPRRTSFP